MTRVSARISKGGRLVIPAEIRRAMNIEEGTAVVLTLENGSLHVRTVREGIRQVQALFAKFNPKPGVSIVDEFIAEKRAEALRENID
jgi:AbrB family looped-hinge helix DNA binding protein